MSADLAVGIGVSYKIRVHLGNLPEGASERLAFEKNPTHPQEAKRSKG